jgi:hypothetical protein
MTAPAAVRSHCNSIVAPRMQIVPSRGSSLTPTARSRPPRRGPTRSRRRRMPDRARGTRSSRSRMHRARRCTAAQEAAGRRGKCQPDLRGTGSTRRDARWRTTRRRRPQPRGPHLRSPEHPGFVSRPSRLRRLPPRRPGHSRSWHRPRSPALRRDSFSARARPIRTPASRRERRPPRASPSPRAHRENDSRGPRHPRTIASMSVIVRRFRAVSPIGSSMDRDRGPVVRLREEQRPQSADGPACASSESLQFDTCAGRGSMGSIRGLCCRSRPQSSFTAWSSWARPSVQGVDRPRW